VRSEANDESLWAEVGARAEAFLGGLHRRGAFPGRRAAEAYFARCGADTTARRELERGVVQLSVGFATLRPGEFATLSLRLHTKQARR
jgi:phage tail sheath protein FI